MAQALAKGIQPEEILYSSYTRNACKIAKQRALERFPQYKAADFKYFRTCHSIAFRLLELDPHQIFDGDWLKKFATEFTYKFSEQENRSDGGDIEIMEATLALPHDWLLFFDEWRKSAMLFNFDEALWKFLSKFNYVPDGFTHNSVYMFIERKEAFKQQHGLFDFSDMLIKVLEEGLAPEVKLAVLDETQDCSPLCFKCLSQFASSADEVYWIGDSDQTIYSFMAADPHLFLDIKSDEDIVLRQSYRVPKSAYEVAQSIIKRNSTRYPYSDYKPTNVEGIVERTGSIPWDEILDGQDVYFIHRTRYLVGKWYDRLISSGIPFYTNRGQKSPLQTKKGRAVHTLMRLGNGEKVTLAEVWGAIDDFLPARPWLKNKSEVERAAKADPEKHVGKVELFDLGFIYKFFDYLYGVGIVDILKFAEEERSYFKRLVDKFGAQSLTKDPTILLSTIHGIKGGECDTCIVNMQLTKKVQDAYWASDENKESENRVFYVAATRTRNRMILLPSLDWRSFEI